MKTEIKPTLAEQMRERTNKSTFNKILKGIRAEADKNNGTYTRLNLDSYTSDLLKEAGFQLTVEPYFEFTKTYIRW